VTARGAALRDLVEELAQARIGTTFNQYRDSDGDDLGPESPRIRSDNLLRDLQRRRHADVLLVAEAAGWRGARYSGLCLFCERQFGEHAGLRRSSRHPRGWCEPSATVVQSAIAPWSDHVLLWNLVPTHPRMDAQPHTNRAPTGAEVRAGLSWTQRLIDIVRPRHIGAIGRLAATALGGGVPGVRHPSHGGAHVCRDQLQRLLTEWCQA
jgi:hypothetical protein